MDMLLESFNLDSFQQNSIPGGHIAKSSASGAEGFAASVCAQGEEATSLVNLRRMLAPFVLRRLKADVLHQLVAKEDEVLLLPMASSQQACYDGIIDRHLLRKKQQAVKTPDLEVSGWVPADAVGVESLSSSEANNIFTSLRKACNHPLLLRQHFQSEDVLRRIATVCYATGRFGVECDFQRVYDEILQVQ